jgi:putative transposase
MSTYSTERAMYRWRRMSPEVREQALAERKRQRRPWHSPPHYASDTSLYLITASCYEHRAVIGYSHKRMASFEAEWLDVFCDTAQAVHAWTVLPNHYHAIVQTCDVRALLSCLGRLHGRTSYEWNGEEKRRGRKVWCNAAETAMKSERHFWATLLYVLHNAVKHGYVERWQDWPYSNAAQWLDEVGRERAARLWREYPIGDYGAAWDPPEL